MLLRLIGGVLLGWTAALTGRLLGADPSPLDPSSPVTWVSFGVAGIVTVSFAKEWVVPGSALRRAEARAQVNETALREAAPALAAANVVQGRMLDYLAEQERAARREGP